MGKNVDKNSSACESVTVEKCEELNNYVHQQITKEFDLDYTALKFLLIDDNFFLQDSIKIQLEKLGAVVDCAENGQVGLELYLNDPERYNIILSDIEMPVMDGLETAKQIRESNLPTSKSVRIIALTGRMLFDDPRSQLFDGSLKKPFNTEQLDTTIKEALMR